MATLLKQQYFVVVLSQSAKIVLKPRLCFRPAEATVAAAFESGCRPIVS